MKKSIIALILNLFLFSFAYAQTSICTTNSFLDKSLLFYDKAQYKCQGVREFDMQIRGIGLGLQTNLSESTSFLSCSNDNDHFVGHSLRVKLGVVLLGINEALYVGDDGVCNFFGLDNSFGASATFSILQF